MMGNIKRLEIGSLIEGGAIVEIQDGNHGELHPKATDYVDDGIPFVMANDLVDNRVDVSRAQKIPLSMAEDLRIGFAQSGDVLLTHKGTIGSTAIVDNADPYWMLTPQVTYYRTNPHKLNNWYLMYAFQEPIFQKTMKSRADQATRPYIGITAQRSLEVLFRPIDEQLRVVNILRPYDEMIANNHRRIVLLQQSAGLMFREWFVDLHYPGHQHSKVVDGVPEGWERKSAFEAIDILSGGTPKTSIPDYWDGDIPFYTPKDAAEFAWVLSTERSITERGLNNCNSRLYPKGTVFISARGTVGKLNLAQQPMAMSQSCYALVGRGNMNQLLVYCAMESALAALQQQAGGAVFNAIIVDTFKRLTVLVPRRQIAREFEELAAPMFAQVELLQIQSEKLVKARDLLLPRLMDGRISV
jgi:type I restriction enzyme, S subunit